MLVFVLNKEGKPLMPCKPRKARILLKNGKAKIVNRCPFTIRLLFGSSGYTQKNEGSIISSSSNIGVAVKSNNKCIYSAEIELRKDIPKRMKRRSSYRRTRRNRKTRYRKCRFLNRKSDRKLTPTLRSKLESHEREIRRVEKILPITSWSIIINSIKPDFKGSEDEEWLNLQRQTFERDNFKCRHCKGKSKVFEIHAHHIIHRENNGKNELENLITLCKKCHVEYHQGKITLKVGKHTYRGKLNTEFSIIRKYFKIKKSKETYGFIVKANRQKLKLEPTPINNACSILNILPDNSFYIRNISKGDYQQTKGIRSQQKIPTGKIMGFRKFDKVKYHNQTCFIKGRYSTGYARGMDILNHSIKKLLKLRKNIKILQRRSNSLITQMEEGNACYNLT